MTRRRKWLIVLAVVAALVALLNLPGREASPFPKGMPACAEEDSPGPCYWDAETFGNGRGRSFYVDDEQGVHYLP